MGLESTPGRKVEAAGENTAAQEVGKLIEELNALDSGSPEIERLTKIMGYALQQAEKGDNKGGVDSSITRIGYFLNSTIERKNEDVAKDIQRRTEEITEKIKELNQ